MRLAIVTPWYGQNLLGGAEQLAWGLSHALARTGAAVDVLTTCSRSFLDDWSLNYHRAGAQTIDGRIVVRRFRLDSRDRVAFNRVNATLTTIPRTGLRGDRTPLDGAPAREFVSENLNSRALVQHLRDHRESYDAVLFLPYLYGTTLTGIAPVADRAFLIPCLHDEAYAYIEPVRTLFDQAHGLLFNSLGEEETAAAIYGPGIFAKSRVIGHAVEPVAPPTGLLHVGAFAPHRSRYVLYLGRQDQTKNIDFLIRAFRTFRTRRVATSMQLVLAGPRSASRSEDGIVDLGPVSEGAKAALLTYARALAQPSVNESFSRAIYESWYARRPAIVHAACRATARALEESGGGWSAETLEQWTQVFATIDESSDEAIDALGERGFAAALDNGTWDAVARRTLDAIEARSPRRLAAVEHLVPLGNRPVARYAQALAEALRETGGESEVVITDSAAFRAGAARVRHLVGPETPSLADAYVAHDGAVPIPTRRGTLFAADQPTAAGLEERGIAARILPEPVSPRRWIGVRPVHDAWVDGRDVLLSIAPLGAVEARRLLDLFVAYLGLTRGARLLVFASDCDDEARAALLRERSELDLVNEIVLVGDGPAERYTAYRSASVACAVGRALSVEAAVMPLWFDLPVVAIDDPVVAETIEACGLVVDLEPRRLAALLRVITKDAGVRDAILRESRRVRARHAPWIVASTLYEALPPRAPEAHQRAHVIPSAVEGQPPSQRPRTS